jgi:hypothetical protein
MNSFNQEERCTLYYLYTNSSGYSNAEQWTLGGFDVKSYFNVKQRMHVPKAVLIADNASIKHRKQTKLQVILQRSLSFKKLEKF